MAVRIGGLGNSGLPPNIVDQVIEAERIPVKKMQEDKAKIEDKVKLVSDFETKINDINKNLNGMVSAKGFSDMKLVSGFPEIIDGTIDPNVADPGDWEIEVTQLATKPSIVSVGLPDKTETSIGVGYIRFQTPEGEKEVYINKDNSTLEKVAETINRAGVGVQASIINDRKEKGESFKLQLTGSKTGDDNDVIFPSVYMVDGDLDFEFADKLPSQNAKIKLNGQEFEVGDNKINDIIPGLTLNLKQAKVGVPVKLSVTENYDSISDKMKAFVDSYNAALGFIQNQHKLTNDKNGNPRMGPLGGDSMLRMTEQKLRGNIQNLQLTQSSIRRITELGIEFNRNGTLDFKQDKFKKLVAQNPRNVAEFLRGNLINTGFITSIKNSVQSIVDPNAGYVGNRKNNLQKQISTIDKNIERKEKSLEKREEALRRQFAKVDEVQAKLQAQSASLAGIGGR